MTVALHSSPLKINVPQLLLYLCRTLLLASHHPLFLLIFLVSVLPSIFIFSLLLQHIPTAFWLFFFSSSTPSKHVGCLNVEPNSLTGPNRSKLQDMLANLRDTEDLSHMQPQPTPQSRPSVPRFSEHEGNRTEEGDSLNTKHISCPFCQFFTD